MDIDCRLYTYDTKVHPLIKEAAEKARFAEKANSGYKTSNVETTEVPVKKTIHEQLEDFMATDPFNVDTYTYNTNTIKNKTDSNETEAIGYSLDKSMIYYLDKENLDKDILEEAFCRDIDSFNSAFVVSTFPK